MANTILKSEHLQKILACPDCEHSQISVEKDGFICDSCNRRFYFDGGVLDMMPSEVKPMPPFYNSPVYKDRCEKLKAIQQLHYSKNSLEGKLELYFKKQMMSIVNDTTRPFLDIGCGTGSSFDILGYPSEIVGVDINQEMLRQCKNDFPESDCIRCDLITPPFREASFRTIFCLGTLEHIYYLEAFAQAIDRIMTEDGHLYVMIPTEGGLAWNSLRALAHIKYSRLFDIDYRKGTEIEHCNKAVTIENILNKFFIIDKAKAVPFHIGGFNSNLVKLFRLKKRT